MAEESYNTLKIQLYLEQRRRHWPVSGRHILAQYDEDTVVVYQAYKPEIAEYAVQNQRFGGPAFSFDRMSWIKTNFMWMMYRCGWASKKNQERVLAVRITREGFEEILAQAYTIELQKSRKLQTKDITVRLQWDPDHTPSYGKMARRAIQLGLKDETLRKYGTEWVVKIEDITDFVKQQHHLLETKGEEHLMTPQECVYMPGSQNTIARIGLDFHEETQGAVEVVHTKSNQLTDKSESHHDTKDGQSPSCSSGDSQQNRGLVHPLEQLRRRTEKLQHQQQEKNTPAEH